MPTWPISLPEPYVLTTFSLYWMICIPQTGVETTEHFQDESTGIGANKTSCFKLLGFGRIVLYRFSATIGRNMLVWRITKPWRGRGVVNTVEGLDFFLSGATNGYGIMERNGMGLGWIYQHYDTVDRRAVWAVYGKFLIPLNNALFPSLFSAVCAFCL